MTDIKGVEFNEREHTYWYRGRRMYGVTGAIQRCLGRSFPEGVASIDVARSYGSQVHREVESWIRAGCPETLASPPSGAARWVMDRVCMARSVGLGSSLVLAEARVSDFVATASNVDIAIVFEGRTAMLFDIKTGAFDRNYCSLQLNAYRRMFEMSYGIPVLDMAVLCTRSERQFRIYDYKGVDSRVDWIFRYNKMLQEGVNE